jgi:phosphoglycolate phosphatase-like HAD superfamily hydrolase
VLWDIDGTLVQAGQVGRDMFTEAFLAVFGRAPDEVAAGALAMAGRTDHEIALDFLASHRIAGAETHLPAFTEALVALGERPDVVQSLLTGNVEPNAVVKLAAFGLEGYLDFDVGGFGSDHRHRPSLVGVARRKAERKYGVAFDGDATVLVGDTPLDVAAGRDGGARVVAVATGPYRVEALQATGADAVLPDLRDTERVLAAILTERIA